MFGTVEIQPLTQKAVKNSLDRLEKNRNKTAGSLLKDFKKNAVLRKALSTAFFVHIALTLYTNLKDSKRILKATPYDVQKELILMYLQREMNNLSEQTDYNFEKIHFWLSWLARRMAESRKGITFELADLQPTWVGHQQKEKVIYGLFEGLHMGLILGILVGLFGGSVKGSVIGLLIGLFQGPYRVIVGEDSSQIFYKDTVTWNWSNISLTKFFNGLITGLFRGIVVGLFIGVLVCLFGGVAFNFIEGLIFSIALGFAFGTVSGLFESIVRSFRRVERFQKVYRPYQRLTSGLLRSMVGGGISFALIISILKFQTYSEELHYMFMNLPCLYVVLTGIVIGFLSDVFFTFSVLYLYLFFRGYIPLNIVRFLNLIGHHTGLLEQDGGQWRFRHLLLQKSFINKNKN